MGGVKHSDEETYRTGDPAGPMQLVVLDDEDVTTYPLPAEGRVRIGRSADNEVSVRSPSISRRHAVIEVAGDGAIAVTDVDSANGTRVRGQRVDPCVPCPVLVGDSVELGSVLLVIQRAGPSSEQKIHVAREAPGERARDDVARAARGFVAVDPATVRLFELVDRVARSDVSVLVIGETGVGKEVVAEAIHARSARSGAPYLRLHVAALSPSLVEAELFGHERGAFTGANVTKPGLLEAANGGTVLLDEIGELTPALQIKLLRVLEERMVMRVGAVSPRPIDVRFVAATHRDLRAAIAAGTFREDLFYRLNGITLSIPPLRDRSGDVAPLVRSFLERSLDKSGRRSPPVVAPDALEALVAYSWPGNARELRNAVEHALLLCEGERIEIHHLPPEIVRQASGVVARADAGASAAPPPPSPSEPRLEAE